jgi:hypothetical protein
MATMTEARGAPAATDRQAFLLKRVQPALSGLMDGSLSTSRRYSPWSWPPTTR